MSAEEQQKRIGRRAELAPPSQDRTVTENEFAAAHRLPGEILAPLTLTNENRKLCVKDLTARAHDFKTRHYNKGCDPADPNQSYLSQKLHLFWKTGHDGAKSFGEGNKDYDDIINEMSLGKTQAEHMATLNSPEKETERKKLFDKLCYELEDRAIKLDYRVREKSP